MIVECTKGTLWGNGISLDNENCLKGTTWKGRGTKGQGIMGEILCEMRQELLEHPRPVHTTYSWDPLTTMVQTYLPTSSKSQQCHNGNTIKNIAVPISSNSIITTSEPYASPQMNYCQGATGMKPAY